MISTRDLSQLPDPESLRRLMQSIAMLDAILCPQWDMRYYSFNIAWSDGEQMGSMRDGSGDHYFAHYSSAGCWIKGFAHESPMSPYCRTPRTRWPGIYDGVPAEFAGCLSEPAFVVEDVTFCIWRRPGESKWSRGPVAFPTGANDPDGSEDLLSILDGRPSGYQCWAAGYYETDVSLSAVEHIYRQQPLTDDILVELNPAILVEQVRADRDAIGYPA